ncbi:hypothetical protein ROHU_019159 [Labeo rohita]|uniref:Uncharacterized protein n=1 Tax=Labeo rohita TaxID=84645 RepID=A0A498N301_LABRO|nr:hypothetical protein ROHU_019159 [Labeo rohita]
MNIISKHQNLVSISKDAKTSSENAVPAGNSSAKGLKCDSEVCFPETNKNVEPSSVQDDATQQNTRGDLTANLKMKLLWGKAKEKEKGLNQRVSQLLYFQSTFTFLGLQKQYHISK